MKYQDNKIYNYILRHQLSVFFNTLSVEVTMYWLYPLQGEGDLLPLKKREKESVLGMALKCLWWWG